MTGGGRGELAMKLNRLVLQVMCMGLLAGALTASAETLHLIHTADVRGTVGICG